MRLTADSPLPVLEKVIIKPTIPRMKAAMTDTMTEIKVLVLNMTFHFFARPLLIMLANMRYAPGMPARSCLYQTMLV